MVDGKFHREFSDECPMKNGGISSQLCLLDGILSCLVQCSILNFGIDWKEKCGEISDQRLKTCSWFGYYWTGYWKKYASTFHKLIQWTSVVHWLPREDCWLATLFDCIFVCTWGDETFHSTCCRAIFHHSNPTFSTASLTQLVTQTNRYT